MKTTLKKSTGANKTSKEERRQWGEEPLDPRKQDQNRLPTEESSKENKTN